MNKRSIGWTEEDDKAVKEYKNKVKSGEIKPIPLDEALKLMKKTTVHSKGPEEELTDEEIFDNEMESRSEKY